MYDFSLKNDYYSQVNNMFHPLTSCKNTSVIMALNQAGWNQEVEEMQLNYLRPIQPEDLLGELSEMRGVKEQTESVAPHLFKDHKPISPMWQMPQATIIELNFLIGRISRLVEKTTYDYILGKLNGGYGLAMLGQIKTPSGKTYNHVVSIAGYILDDGGQLESIIIDDPFGDYKTNYNSKQGNGIHVPIDDFSKFFIDYQWHWAIEIQPRKNYSY